MLYSQTLSRQHPNGVVGRLGRLDSAIPDRGNVLSTARVRSVILSNRTFRLKNVLFAAKYLKNPANTIKTLANYSQFCICFQNLCYYHPMDRNNHQTSNVESIHGKVINAINQGFYEALNVAAVVESPLTEYKWLAQKRGSQKGMHEAVHASKKFPQAKKEGLSSNEPFLSLCYQTTLERRTK